MLTEKVNVILLQIKKKKLNISFEKRFKKFYVLKVHFERLLTQADPFNPCAALTCDFWRVGA